MIVALRNILNTIKREIAEDKLFILKALVFLFLSIIWFYAAFVLAHPIDTILYPIYWVLGWRLGRYGFWGLLPFGAWIYNHLYSTIKYKSKTWAAWWNLIVENTFDTRYAYRAIEITNGGVIEKRGATGPIGVYVGILNRGYIFDLA